MSMDCCSAWVLNPETTDISSAGHCTPDVSVRMSDIDALGVFSRRVDPTLLHVKYPNDDAGRTYLERLRWSLGYAAVECVALAEEESGEHFNLDEQIRIIESGAVYLDIRGAGDRWLRVAACDGCVITIPRGLCHRLIPVAGAAARIVRMLRVFNKFEPQPRDAKCAEADAAREEYAHYCSHPPTETIMGPANDEDNILVTDPREFDKVLEKTRAKMSAGDVLVLLFKGSSNRKTHISWCPPCVEAEPMVQRALRAAREKSKHRVFFIQCVIERSLYLGNPEYVYRTHAFIGIVTIPFLMVLKKDGAEWKEIRRERDPGERYESWVQEI